MEETMKKTALVLSGGGAKGAYEIGVWKALEELNIKCDIVTGVSVGSINAALYTQGSLKQAEEYWKKLNIEMIFPIKLKTEDNLEVIKKYISSATTGGLDPSNLKENLTKYLDLNKIYNSKIDYGLITVEFPKIKTKELTKSKIPKDKLIDYIIASSTLFPVFKIKKIDNSKYIDGGFRENIPYNLAKKMGAEKFIIVNISHQKIPADFHEDENHIYLKPHNDIGAPLIFDAKQATKSINYGYNDTMKVFKKLYGKKYTFKDLPTHYQKDNVLKTINIYLDTLEYLGKAYNIDDSIIYNIDEFNNIILKSISSKKTTQKIKELTNPKERIEYIYYNIINKKETPPNKDLLKLLNKEYKSAYYISKII